ncbi:hypothetical protein ACOMHN_033130 [Nucella lapillus]
MMHLVFLRAGWPLTSIVLCGLRVENWGLKAVFGRLVCPSEFLRVYEDLETEGTSLSVLIALSFLGDSAPVPHSAVPPGRSVHFSSV